MAEVFLLCSLVFVSLQRSQGRCKKVLEGSSGDFQADPDGKRSGRVHHSCQGIVSISVELGLCPGRTRMGDPERRARLGRTREAILGAVGRWARPTHRVPPAIAYLLPRSRDLGLRPATHGLHRDHAATGGRHHCAKLVRDGRE